jgi:mRNA interferase MazF
MTRRGDVVVIDFRRSGQPQRKVRPAIVITNDIANQVAGALTVALMTEWSERKAGLPVCVEIHEGVAGATKRSVVDCGQIHTVDRRVIRTTAASLPADILSRVDEALKIHLAL